MAVVARSRSRFVLAALVVAATAIAPLSAQQRSLPDLTTPGARRPATSPNIVADAALEGEQVVDVRVVGHRNVSLQKIVPQIKTRANRPYNAEQVEEDVRRLTKTRLFVSVDTTYQHVPAGGIILIFRVVERPSLKYVKYVGNTVRVKTLAKQTGLKAGDSLDPYMVVEARRKLEEWYVSKGFSKAKVTIIEGDKPGDAGAVLLINEGQKQRVFKVQFVGNTIASDSRLRTQVKSKPPLLYLFKGEVDRDKIDNDVDLLTTYYRSLGFFRARIGRELEFNEKQNWLTLTFVIDEGPRYKIRSISVVGNKKFEQPELLKTAELKSGEYFDQKTMEGDVNKLQNKYGSVGYIFAAVEADPRFLEEPGQLDLVYQVSEGDRYRVGRIEVRLHGENPRTRRHTILNRVSIYPGDIADTRELKDSERRLRASGLFANKPADGKQPTITFKQPGLDDDDVDDDKPKRGGGESSTARAGGRHGGRGGGGGGGFRGQSPDDYEEDEQWVPPPGCTDKAIVIRVDDGWVPGVDAVPQNAVVRAQSPDGFQNAPSSPLYRSTAQGSNGGAFPQPGQVPMGRTNPDSIVGAGNYGTGAPITPVQYAQPVPGASVDPTAPARPYPVQQAAPGYPVQGAAVPSGPVPTYPVPTYPVQPFPPPPQQPVGSVPQAAPSYAAPPGYYGQPPAAVQAAPNIYPQAPPGAVGGPLSVPPGSYAPPAQLPQFNGQPITAGDTPQSILGPGAGSGVPPIGAPPGTMPPVGATNPNELFPQGGYPFVQDDNLRDTDAVINVEETQTGRFMVGVGVNSSAGLLGSITLDEQNFDIRRWPTSWEELRNGTAFRGAGQQMRLEAMPGTVLSRYSATFREPYLFDTRINFGLTGYYYQRYFASWNEYRAGGRISFGYQLTPDLSTMFALRGEAVTLKNPQVPTPPELASALGTTPLTTAKWDLIHDTRDSTFMATEGHYVDLSFEQAFGYYNFPRPTLDARQHFLLHERPDRSGRQTLTLMTNIGWTGPSTPIFENFFAGGYQTLRGFYFRGASPQDMNVFVGGHFQWINTVEYMFPLMADDMLRGVVFCDFGTVEPSTELKWQDYRISPGIGLRITIPAMGPAPIALDLAAPVHHALGDQIQNFSFFVGYQR